MLQTRVLARNKTIIHGELNATAGLVIPGYVTFCLHTWVLKSDWSRQISGG